MLAYYIALRIGLTRPYWAIATCYIVAQPLSGAVLSKAAFRMIGTGVGAIVALLLVPNLVNAPELLSLALALWLGLCTYLSLLDRTPRAYIFLLAGYTAGIIGFPAVNAPQTIFTIASLRVQEITIGIGSALLIHGLFFPRTVTARLLTRVDAIMGDAERWSADALSLTTRSPRLDRDRRRLALDLHELHQLSIHLPYDTARIVPRVDMLRALQDRLSLLLPLASAIEDRMTQLTALPGGLPAPIAGLVEDVRGWLTGHGGGRDRDAEAAMLISRARALEAMDIAAQDWSTALRLSLLDRLADLIAAHRDCHELRALLRRSRRAISPELRATIRSAARRPLHRDHGTALRAGLATTLTVIGGCAFWIVTQWPDGAGAVVLASIICALFSNLDVPAPVTRQVLYGTAIAVLLAAVYGFIILPRVSDFIVLAAVFAPAFLVVGKLLVQPKTSALAIGIILTLPGILNLSDSYQSDFGTFLNAAAGQLLGALLAVVMLYLVRTVGAKQAAYRLIRIGWRELARRATAGGMPNTSAWISQMLDRVALLTPRLTSLGLNPAEPILDILADTRIGISVDALRRFQAGATGRDIALAAMVLRRVQQHFAHLTPTGPMNPDPPLLRTIDIALARIGVGGDPSRRRDAVLALTSLRRNLAPNAQPPAARNDVKSDKTI